MPKSMTGVTTAFEASSRCLNRLGYQEPGSLGFRSPASLPEGRRPGGVEKRDMTAGQPPCPASETLRSARRAKSAIVGLVVT